jgi:adenine-specific DNA-methyltransferase
VFPVYSTPGEYRFAMPVLQFRGRSFIERHHEALPHHSLVPDADLSVVPEGATPTVEGNLLVEGDNLLALEALLPHYRGRVKCVYIDPPYNTGNEHWVYNDNVSAALFKEWLGREVGPQGEDFSRHDKWCCMMYPRLQLLRELLREDGVIFVSIDDNEVHHLRMLMDEIFGEENFVIAITWRRTKNKSNMTRHFSNVTDYILVYAKEAISLKTNKIGSGNTGYKYTDAITGKLYSRNTILDKKRGGHRYEVKTPGGQILTGPWVIRQVEFDRLIDADLVHWSDGKNETPYKKVFLEDTGGLSSPDNFWDSITFGSNQDGSVEMESIFGVNDAFAFPKPTKLLRTLLSIGTTGDDDIILDSFAGSGTTGHAVLQLNAEDGGNRRFILVQMPHDSKDDEGYGLLCNGD